MKFIGQKVIHKTLGQGEITWFGGKNQNDHKYIVVQFATKSMEFPYPVAFSKHLKTLNSDFADLIKKDMANDMTYLIEKIVQIPVQLKRTIIKITSPSHTVLLTHLFLQIK